MDFNITKTYIPMNEKMDSIQRVLSASLDVTTGTYKVGAVEVFSTVEIAKLYTDIKLPEDAVEAYDYLAENGFDYCGKDEAEIDIKRYRRFLREQIEKLEKYQTSAYGILDAIKNDYDNLNFDIDSLGTKLSNSEGIETVKEIVTKLG